MTPGPGAGIRESPLDPLTGRRGPTDDFAHITRRREFTIAPTARIRGDFPALRADARGPSRGVLRRPGRDSGPHGRRRCDGRLPDVAQREHALGVPQQRGDGLRDGRGPARPRGLPQRRARGDRLRRQHDDPDLPPGACAGAIARDRATPIVVTELDHHANIDPWRALERERGVEVHQVKMIAETGLLDWDDLDRCLTDHRTRLLAIGAASNAPGHDQRRRPCHGHGPRGRGADVRRRRALRAAPARGRPGMGLRLPRVLGLQVLRAAHRRPLRPPRSDRGSGGGEARARARRRPPSGWNGHAESRGDRRRCGGGRLSRLIGR